jgi:hypothetical protein
MGNYAEIMAPYEAHYKNLCMIDTWGHLAPKHRKTYKCQILFSWSEWSRTELISTRFSDDLEMSPWLYEGLNEYIYKVAHKRKRYGVYMFVGIYYLMNNGRHVFKGEVKYVPIPLINFK